MLQTFRHCHQQPVAGGVAPAVVDEFEPVEVEEEYGDEGAVPAGPGEGSGEAVAEEGPIRQAGERIVERLVGERRRRLLAFADVPDGGGDQQAVSGLEWAE